MARTVPFTGNRAAISDLLTRAKRFHCNVASVQEFDVTTLLGVLDTLRAQGRKLSLNACLVKASALLLEKQPRLNHHLFHRWFRRQEVAFDGIHCNFVMLRKDEHGEKVLLPLVLRDANRLSVDDIQERLRHHARTPLEKLPEFQAIQRMKRLPRLLQLYFSYKCRSDARFYERYFGTYGFSSLLGEDPGGVRETLPGAPTQAATNVCLTFMPAAVSSLPRVVDGQLQVRKVLSMTLVADHYLVDGHDVRQAAIELTALLERPESLGLSDGRST